MKLITKNKAAYMEYEIMDTYDTGIVLLWHEVKSIKGGHINISDAIVGFDGTTMVVKNMDIPFYEKANLRTVWGNYNAKWPRGLLLTKLERTKIVAKTTKTWLAIVPLQVYIAKNGRIKVTIGVGKLRKKVEKKQVIKERDIKRDMDREIKAFKG